MEKKELYKKINDAILHGDKETAVQAAEESLKMNLEPTKTIQEAYTPAIQKVGILWEEGEYFLPELVMSAEAMKAAMAILKPEIEKRQEIIPQAGTVVIGTIEGDIHDIGKSLVAALFSAAGFKVFDLGFDVPVDEFVRQAQEKKADIIGISALLTTTMIGQKKVIQALKKAGQRELYKVLVGGAPVSKKWAEEIGADAAPMGAVEAVRVARALIAK